MLRTYNKIIKEMMDNIDQILKGKLGQLICGDCLKVLKTFPDSCIDTMITDPP